MNAKVSDFAGAGRARQAEAAGVKGQFRRHYSAAQSGTGQPDALQRLATRRIRHWARSLMENQPAVKFAAGLAKKHTSHGYYYILLRCRQAERGLEPARDPG